MIGFTNPHTGVHYLLVGSHTSTVRVGREPTRKPGCAGCRTAKGIEAGTAETPQEVRAEGREPGAKGIRPEGVS